MTDRHPSGFHHIDGYCPSKRGAWYCNRTIKRDGMCGIHADAADRAKTRAPRPTYAELRAERDALELYLSRVEMALRVAADARDEAEAAVERVRVLAERWRTHAGTGSLAADVFGRQTVTVDTAVAEIVRAIGRADA